MKLFIAGGNRKFEDEPLKYIVSMSKRLGIQIEILTDKIHLNKECKSFKNLKNFLIKNQIKHRVFNNLNLEFSKIKKSLIGRNNYLLATNCIWIFKNNILNMFKNKIFNLHIGILPTQKGAGGASWQLMARNKVSAATIHQMTNTIDDGKILFEKKFKINKEISLVEYYKLAAKAEKKILKRFLSMIKLNKKINLKKQNLKNSIYMPRLDTATHGFINWEWNGHDIYNFIRAFDEPYMGASTFYKNKKIYLSNVKILEIKKTFHPFQSGLIVRKDKKSIYIAMRNGLLKISTIKNENFKKYNISYFNLGERLHTPSNILDKAKTGKSSHTGKGIKITYG